MNYKKRSSEDGGFVLVVVALVLIILIGFVALGVDAGILYSARNTAQTAADAASLAGAYTFVVNPTGPQPATAEAAARSLAKQYAIFGTPIVDADIDVTMTTADVAARRVPVVVRARQQTYFAQVLGIGNADILVTSLAEAGPSASVEPDPKPFFLPNTILSPEETCAACNLGVVGGQMLIDPASGIVTAFGLSQIGEPIVIKPQTPEGALQPSLFYLIDFDGSGGGTPQIQNWISGAEVPPPVACGDVIPVAKGNKVAIKFGVEDLIGAPDDIYEDVGVYYIDGGAPSDTSKALISVPVWDTCASGFCTTDGIPKEDGHQMITVIGFAVIFLDGITETGSGPEKEENLMGHLINISGCSDTPSGAGSTVIGAFPLRLVRQ